MSVGAARGSFNANHLQKMKEKMMPANKLTEMMPANKFTEMMPTNEQMMQNRQVVLATAWWLRK